MLHPDRLFPSDNTQRELARRLYAEIKDLPIVSPHGHTDPACVITSYSIHYTKLYDRRSGCSIVSLFR